MLTSVSVLERGRHLVNSHTVRCIPHYLNLNLTLCNP